MRVKLEGHHPGLGLSAGEPAASPGWSQQPARPERCGSCPRRSRRTCLGKHRPPPLTILALDAASRARGGPSGSSSRYAACHTPKLQEVIVKKKGEGGTVPRKSGAAQGALNSPKGWAAQSAFKNPRNVGRHNVSEKAPQRSSVLQCDGAP